MSDEHESNLQPGGGYQPPEEAVDAHVPTTVIEGGANGGIMPTRNQRRAQARAEVKAKEAQRADHMQKLAWLQAPPTREEMYAELQGVQAEFKRAYEVIDTQKQEIALWKKNWAEVRMVVNHLSVRNTALMRALLTGRVWGKPVLAELDYQRALALVEEEMRVQAEQARALRAQSSEVSSTPPPSAGG
jgi:hypothetical protein